MKTLVKIAFVICIAFSAQSCLKRYYLLFDPYEHDHHTPELSELYGLWVGEDGQSYIRLNEDGTCIVKNVRAYIEDMAPDERFKEMYMTLGYYAYGVAPSIHDTTVWDFQGYWKMESYSSRDTLWYRISMGPNPIFSSDLKKLKGLNNHDYKSIEDGYILTALIHNKKEKDKISVCCLYTNIGDLDTGNEYIFLPRKE